MQARVTPAERGLTLFYLTCLHLKEDRSQDSCCQPGLQRVFYKGCDPKLVFNCAM